MSDETRMTDQERGDWPLIKPSRIIETREYVIKQIDPLCIAAFPKFPGSESFGLSFGTYHAASRFFRKLQRVTGPDKYLKGVSQTNKGYID